MYSIWRSGRTVWLKHLQQIYGVACYWMCCELLPENTEHSFKKRSTTWHFLICKHTAAGKTKCNNDEQWGNDADRMEAKNNVDTTHGTKAVKWKRMTEKQHWRLQWRFSAATTRWKRQWSREEKHHLAPLLDLVVSVWNQHQSNINPTSSRWWVFTSSSPARVTNFSRCWMACLDRQSNTHVLHRQATPNQTKHTN